MRLGVLFSGGKDSAYALYRAQESEEVVCLISILSKNEESYMFHVPNIGLTSVQAEAMGLPVIQETTEGVKEEELQDLKRAIARAQDMYGIEGVVTGAIESVYQAGRIQRICHDLDVWCFNPLWLMDQVQLLHELVQSRFSVIITGVFAYPMTEEWLGKEIDAEMVEELEALQKEHMISPSGEGGEIETTVLDAPFFKKRIVITDFGVRYDEYSGFFLIKEVELVEK